MDKQCLIESLKREGFSEEILEAFRKVRREDFVPANLEDVAYEDEALPLEAGATISQPYTIAFMLRLLELEKGQKILEIGSGCGYVLALLSEITQGEIFGIEIINSLAKKSKEHLKNYENIKVISGDGSKGLTEEVPFDRILISAAASEVPENLYSQLKDGGILVAPVRDSILQIKKKGRELVMRKFPGFVFVPLKKGRLFSSHHYPD